MGGVLPAGISGFPATFGLGQFGGFGGLGGLGGNGGFISKRPIYVINKSP